MKKLLGLLLLSPLISGEQNILDCSANSLRASGLPTTKLDGSSYMSLTINSDKKLVDVYINTWGFASNINYITKGNQTIEFEVIINRGEQTNLINNYTLNRISGEFVEKTNKYSSSNKKFIENLFTTYGICSKKKAIF